MPHCIQDADAIKNSSVLDAILVLLIHVYTERFTEGVSDSVSRAIAFRRELIHILIASPTSYATIVSEYPALLEHISESDLNALLKSIAV